MTDYLSPEERSRQMARIRGRDTKPERVLRQMLHRAGFRFRLHARNLPGRPDLVLPRHKAAILVHGCFWHRHAGCGSTYEPKSRVDFWTRKFDENVERDRRQIEALRKAGWRVAVVWECGLRRAEMQASTTASVIEWLRSKRPALEAPPKSTRHTQAQKTEARG